MRFIIENVAADRIEYLIKKMRSNEFLIAIGITNICTETEWFEVGNWGIGREEELRLVLSFEIPDHYIQDDTYLRVLTSVFEGKGLIFSAPDLPGFRFEIA